jgi:hypothetical protein
MKNRYNLLYLILSILFSISILSCGLGGGGGGGGNELIAADVSISADPIEIDSGDRSRISVFLSDVKEDGVLLKFRYSNKFAYVRNSSTLVIDGHEFTVSASAEDTVGAALSGETYLVYDLPHSLFGESDNGEIRLVIEGLAKINNGKIEVDADFNDPNQTIAQKFNILSPEFEPKDFVKISVVDDSGQIRPTVTPTPTITLTASVTPTVTSTRTPRPSSTPTPE